MATTSSPSASASAPAAAAAAVPAPAAGGQQPPQPVPGSAPPKPTAAAVTYRRLVVPPGRRGRDFRAATDVETTRVALPLADAKAVLIRVDYAGVNASDINFTAGAYEGLPSADQPGGAGKKVQERPLHPGFEYVGRVVFCGDEAPAAYAKKVGPQLAAAHPLRVGAAVVGAGEGAYGEYVQVPARNVAVVPASVPGALCLPVSGLTAEFGLFDAGKLQAGETVLVTAAAGGTGSIAVQLAKAAGCKVFGTCSTDEKCDFLKGLGCDRPINYNKEDLMKVLRAEAPKGIDVVYECVGGRTFDIAVSNLAIFGRLVVIGAISEYQDGSAWKQAEKKTAGVPLQMKLLSKSAVVAGCFLNHYVKEWAPRMAKLASMSNLQLPTTVLEKDVENIHEAVQHMYDGKSTGKLVVAIQHADAAPTTRASL